MTDRVDLQEFLGAFVIEAEEIVAAATTSLLEIEVAIGAGTLRPRAVRDLFRGLHTIKGLAGMIGVDPIVELAHAIETLVRAADRAGGVLPRRAVEVALQGVAAISERVRAVAESRAVPEVPDRLLEALAEAVPTATAPVVAPSIPLEWESRLSPGERQQLALALQSEVPVWAVSFVPSELNASRGITITTVRAALGARGDIIKVVPRALAVTEAAAAGVAFEILLASHATQSAIAAVVASDSEQVIRVTHTPPVPDGGLRNSQLLDIIDDETPTLGRAVVRVELSRLDELQDQLSLLIVSRFRLERELTKHADLGHDVRGLREIAQLQGRQLRDLRRAILRARMVRVAEVLEPLSLLVRSLARSGQRVVQLELDACHVELDKAVADRLLPALIHLVRNAVDHGIENPEQRVLAGKPRVGTVRVSCAEVAGNHVEIIVRDDGRGIDRAAIARQANRAVDDDATLLEILTATGFSTRTVATTTSGRGLGMDIVHRTAVGDLGGTLSLTTELGVGSVFTLRVPVTIAVMEVFAFTCGPQSFVVPATVVQEIFEVLPEMLVVPPAPHLRSTIAAPALIERRGHAIPLISLGAILGIARSGMPDLAVAPNGGESIASGEHGRKAMVIRRNGDPIAFTVDRMIGRQEVVVRTVDDPLVNVPGVVGATDLGDGRPTLVLDLCELGVIARERGMS